MSEISRSDLIRWPTGECAAIAARLAKTVFVAFGASAVQVHGADGAGHSVLRKKHRRGRWSSAWGSF